MNCPNHPGREIEFLDPVLKTLVCSVCFALGPSTGHPCVTLEDAFQEEQREIPTLLQRNEARRTELHGLSQSLSEARSILDLREEEAVRRIQEEAGYMIRALKRREEELVELTRRDSDAQRHHLDGVISKVNSYLSNLEEHHSKVSDEKLGMIERLYGIKSNRHEMEQSSFVELMESKIYRVHSRPIAAESHLSLVRTSMPHNIHCELLVPLQASGGGAVTVDAPTTYAEYTKGILNFIATAGLTKEYRNPMEHSFVTVTSNCGVLVGDYASLLEEPTADNWEKKCFRTQSMRNARLLIDFRDKRQVRVAGYSLTHGHETEHAALRNWNLIGSMDGIHWVSLDERRNDDSLTGPYKTAYYTCNFPTVVAPKAKAGAAAAASGVSGTTAAAKSTQQHQQQQRSKPANQEFWRYVAVEVRGPNAAGTDFFHIELAHIELFGSMQLTT